MHYLQSSDSGFDTLIGAMLGFMVCLYAILFVVAIIQLIGMWKVYTKAGQPGWATLIPIYNILVYLDIIRKPRIWLVYIFGGAILNVILVALLLAIGDSVEGLSFFTGLLVFLVNAAYYIGITVLSILMVHNLSLVFGQSTAFTVGLIFLPFIFIPVLGFGDAQYQYGVSGSSNSGTSGGSYFTP